MKKYDVTGLGSALLDLTFEVDDSILAELNLKKGSMHLIDRMKSKEILEKLKNHPCKISPGGSSANTISGINSLGGKGVFLGKIGNDIHGDLYEKKTLEEGTIPKLSRDKFELTGHAITLITSDFERTFATHLGASLYFSKRDVLKEEIKNSKILHLEGYQLEDTNLREAVIYAIEIAKLNNMIISLDLSESNLIKRNLDFFKKFVKDYVDIVFVNETEAEAFTGKKEEEALNEISHFCKIAIVKLGERGSLIKSSNRIYQIPSFKTNVINTNGAGDMYASGILYGLANNLDLKASGTIASFAASLVVASSGARLDNLSINKLSCVARLVQQKAFRVKINDFNLCLVLF